PELILLDLKLPGLSGLDVLRWIRAQARFFALPVIVLTSSDDIRDVNSAYALGANSFLVKPTDFNDFLQLAHSISENWFQWSNSRSLQPGRRVSNLLNPGNKKVLLRDRASLHFYASRSAWVSDKES